MSSARSRQASIPRVSSFQRLLIQSQPVCKLSHSPGLHHHNHQNGTTKTTTAIGRSHFCEIIENSVAHSAALPLQLGRNAEISPVTSLMACFAGVSFGSQGAFFFFLICTPFEMWRLNFVWMYHTANYRFGCWVFNCSFFLQKNIIDGEMRRKTVIKKKSQSL